MASRAIDKLKASKSAALARIKRIRDNSKDLEHKGIGVAVGFVAAKYYGSWLAKRVKDKQATQVPKLKQSYGRVGGLAAIAYGMFSEDERTGTAALIGGAALLGADEGINAYVAEMSAAPAGGGGG